MVFKVGFFNNPKRAIMMVSDGYINRGVLWKMQRFLSKERKNLFNMKFVYGCVVCGMVKGKKKDCHPGETPGIALFFSHRKNLAN